MSKKERGLENVCLMSGKRAHIVPADESGDWDWWVGFGKDESCQYEGPWLHHAIMAAKILSHPNTKAVAPNLYREDISLTEEQERNY